MSESKRQRASSKLDNLPPEKFHALRDGLINRTFTSQAQAQEWVATTCGFTTSAAALSTFYVRHCAPFMVARSSEPPSQAATLERLLEAVEKLTAAVEANTEELRKGR